MRTTVPDYSGPVPVLPDVYWIGDHDTAAGLRSHPYLLIDADEAVLIDPGSLPHFPVVMRKAMEVADPERITTVVASNHDPDVCGSLAVVEEVLGRTDLTIAAHTNSIRFLRHYGVRSPFYPVDAHEMQLRLRSGRALEFLAAPFLHTPGTIVTYDRRTRTLFSSDLFGGISEDGTLFADGNVLAAMDRWHQTYIPSNALLAAAIHRLEQLEIDRLLPQHGSILEGAHVRVAMDHLKALPCGSDLF